MSKKKIAVFVDGDYWHGNNWALRGMESLEEELAGYSEYWRSKIRKNIERDEKNNSDLSELGFTVLRFWESEIRRDLDECVNKVITEYYKTEQKAEEKRK